ncbi:MAG: phosphatidate cytidylyltransferase [Candidatus Dependentiae bacterium]|jgi:CDP-diglyceride synthetase|nr:phosphatidate cytidylyltransferase [Candidatus Dependentiae bacterium]
MIRNLLERSATGVAFVALLAATYFLLPPVVLSLLLFATLGFVLFVEWPKVGIAGLTPWYPVLPFALLIILNYLTEYRALVPLIFALAMTFDIGSYLAGTFVGRHKVAPFISPKKTWEGFIGGIAMSLLLLYLPPLSTIAAEEPLHAVLLVIFVDIIAFAGDLFVSLLKRRAGIKDCSGALPGHGGILDRFDSILFVTFVIFALRKYLIH